MTATTIARTTAFAHVQETSGRHHSTYHLPAVGFDRDLRGKLLQQPCSTTSSIARARKPRFGSALVHSLLRPGVGAVRLRADNCERRAACELRQSGARVTALCRAFCRDSQKRNEQL